MLVKKSRVSTFDDWVDYFHQWREDIGYPTEMIGKEYLWEKKLLERAPTQYDKEAMLRVNREEMRHGWQMGYLLVTHFGDAGKKRSERLLERRAGEHTRLLGSFNEPVNNWLDFFTYTDFIDRDGKYQLNMLSRSAFAPLGRSMLPMLKEEAYHLAQGNIGLMRIIKAKRVPAGIMQKYFNKWLSTAFDQHREHAA